MARNEEMCMKNKLKDGFKQIKNIALENAHDVAVKVQDENRKALLKKYNPIFLEDYPTENFGIIVITDDSNRKDVDVCKGAIGWKSTNKDMDVLHLYDTAIDKLGLKFLPTPTKESFYYVDELDRSRYIKLDSYFDTMQEAMVAELAHIAFSLGAKKYSIDLEEISSETIFNGKKANVNIKNPFGAAKGNADASADFSSEIRSSKNIANDSNFSTGAPPVHPNLRIFKNNDMINNLIDMRMKGQLNKNSMGGHSIRIKKSNYSNINSSIASKIDATVNKINAKASCKLEKKRKKEEIQILVYRIEF